MSRYSIESDPVTGVITTIKERFDSGGNILNPARVITQSNGQNSDGLNFAQIVPLLRQCDAAGGQGGSTIISTRRFVDTDTSNPNAAHATYVELLRSDIASDGTVSTSSLGYFTDSSLTTPYTPQFTQVAVPDYDSQALGVSQHRVHLTGPVLWGRPAGAVQSLTIKVREVGDTAQPPAISDASGNATPMFEGDIESWSAIGGGQVLTDQFSLALGTNDVVTVIYTVLEV